MDLSVTPQSHVDATAFAPLAHGPQEALPSMRQRWVVAALVFLSFAVFSALRAPVPGVNEPHYLCKARHFWDNGWCSRDPFLQSANAHALFYWTIGWLTQWLTLEQTAW